MSRGSPVGELRSLTSSLAGMRLLIVDGSGELLTCLPQFAQQWGAVPLVEKDAPSCVEATFEDLFDAVILNLRVPENLEWLRSFRRVSSLPVVAIEAGQNHEFRLSAFEAGDRKSVV